MFGLFKRKVDPMATYMQARLVLGTDGATPLSAIYEDYCRWCEGTGNEPVILKDMLTAIRARGCGTEKIGGRIRCIGVALKP